MVPGQQPLPQHDHDKGDDRELQENYRKRRAEHTPILINEAVVEQVENFKFVGTHITNELSWSKHIKTVVKRALQCLFLTRFGMGPHILKKFYSCTIKSNQLVASLPGVATVRPPTGRHYRG